MKWKELKRAYSELLIKVREDKNFSKEWNKFKEIANEIAKKAASCRFIYSLFTKYFRKEN